MTMAYHLVLPVISLSSYLADKSFSFISRYHHNPFRFSLTEVKRLVLNKNLTNEQFFGIVLSNILSQISKTMQTFFNLGFEIENILGGFLCFGLRNTISLYR